MPRQTTKLIKEVEAFIKLWEPYRGTMIGGAVLPTMKKLIKAVEEAKEKNV